MNYQQELTDKIGSYVTGLFTGFQNPELLYHNLDHTHYVVERVREISENHPLKSEQLFALIIAAWFHDSGHLFGGADGHEARGAAIMRTYMGTVAVNIESINLIEQYILATRFPCKPSSLPEAIICDADSYHLGTDEFWKTNALVKHEFELRNECIYSNWDELSLSFLEQHQYFTDYCKILLNARKQQTIQILRDKISS